MRTLLMMFATGLLVASLAAQEGADGDKKKIQGTWKMLSSETDGEKATKKELEKLRVVITADTLIITSGDGTDLMNDYKIKYDYKIDPSAKPKALDVIEHRLGARPGKWIYDLDGDSLKICQGKSGPDRPKAFESKPKSGITVMIFKRQK